MVVQMYFWAKPDAKMTTKKILLTYEVIKLLMWDLGLIDQVANWKYCILVIVFATN